MIPLIQSLSGQVFFSIIGFCTVVGGLFAFAATRGGRSVRLLRNTSRVRIGSPTKGVVAIRGRAERIADADLRAPLTGVRCLWYRASVEHYARVDPLDTESSPRWSTLCDRRSEVPFLVSDGSGACIVEPDTKEVTPKDESLWFGGTAVPEDRNPPRVEGLTSGEGAAWHNTAGRSFRYKEGCFYEGNEVFVIGEFDEITPEEVEDRAADEACDDETGSSAADAELAPLYAMFKPTESPSRVLAAGSRSTVRRMRNCRCIAALPIESLVSRLDRGNRALVVLAAGAGVVVVALLCIRFVV